MTSPPVIVRGVIVVGSSIIDWWGQRPPPPGDVRGFDVVTGRLLWTFHTVAQQGDEPGAETWEKDSWKEAGNANVWAPMSADEELGYVYLPVSTPTNDYYGGDRPGDGLYGESLVCLDVATGKKVWHYQLVHHGLWDYDPPAAPNLIDITVDGKADQGGRAESRSRLSSMYSIALPANPCGRSRSSRFRPPTCPASRLRQTQPIPTRPAPFDIQGARDEDLDRSHAGNSQGGDRDRQTRMIAADCTRRRRSAARSRCPAMPAAPIGPGAAIDPETGTLYVGTQRLPTLSTIRKPEPWQGIYDFIGGAAIPAGTARAAAAEAAVRQHCRHRHEYRRAPLAHSGRAQRGPGGGPEA